MKHDRFITISQRIWIDNEFYGTNNCDYVYVPILKNANTWGKHFFATVAGFKETENFRGKKLIVFLKDPIERWKSSITQWFEQNYTGPRNKLIEPNITIDIWMEKLIFSTIEIDSHGQSQVSFLQGLNLNNCTFFDIGDPYFSLKLAQFVKRQFTNIRFSKDMEIPKLNVSAEDPIKVHVRRQLDAILARNPEYIKRVEKYYQRDMQLFKKVIQ